MSKNNLVLKSFVGIIFLVNTAGCNYLADVKPMGSNYYLDSDQVLLSTTDGYEGFGYCVIPPRVVDYETAPNTILVASENNISEHVYWIILTNYSKKRVEYFKGDANFNGYHKYENVLGPLTKEGFKKKLDSLRIDSKFE